MSSDPLLDRLPDLRRTSRLAVATYPALAVAIGVVLATQLAGVRWAAVGLGAAGWFVALWLRGPVALVAGRLSRDRKRVGLLVAAASGPAEEGVRVLLVLFLVTGFVQALWAGFGWAAIEIVYTIINAVLTPILLARDGERSRQARALLLSQQQTAVAGPVRSVAYGAAERAGVTGMHTGFTLMLAAQPWLALVTAPAHTATNLIALRLSRRSLLLTETMVVLVGVAAMLTGLALSGRL